MPQKKKLSLSEHHKTRPAAEHKLNTGDGQNTVGGSGAQRTTACPPPCTLSVSGVPAVEMGDSLEISWKTFLSVLRSIEEGSENKVNALVPQLVTSQPVLARKKIVTKSEKIRKGRSSALPVILKPGEKSNVIIQKERERSAVVHNPKQDGDKIRIGSGQPDSCGKTPKGDMGHAASKGKTDQASTETDYTQLSLCLFLDLLVPLCCSKSKKKPVISGGRPPQAEVLSQSQLSSQESSRLGTHKVFRQEHTLQIAAGQHAEPFSRIWTSLIFDWVPREEESSLWDCSS
ncbi:uncharacterized protein [Tiliqua scincoides]|uniref:uncharacterized protein n=1 Tax=Tiliqua scincoides TaxID=71010 RepID=UPI003462CA71